VNIRHMTDTASLMDLIGRMSEGVQLNEQGKAMGIGQVIGMLSMHIAHRAARPYQYLIVLLVCALLAVIGLWWWDSFTKFMLILQLTLGG